MRGLLLVGVIVGHPQRLECGLVALLSLSAQAANTECYRLCDCYRRYFFVTVLETEKSRIKIPAQSSSW